MNKAPICWIHGWGMSAELWKPLNAAYLPTYDHVYVDFSACENPSDFLRAIQLQMRQYELSHAENDYHAWTIVGWSMGALLAVELAASAMASAEQIAWPIERLVVTSGTLSFISQDRSKGWPARVLRRMKQGLKQDSEGVLSQFRASVLGPVAASSHPSCNYSWAGLSAGLDYLIQTDVSSAWSNIQNQHPSGDYPGFKQLWIHGTLDEVCPVGAIPAETRDLDIQLIEAGHAPFLTDSKRFYDLLRSFLNASIH